MWRSVCPPVCTPAYRLFVKQRLSPAKNFNSLECLCWKKSLQRSALQTETSVNFAPENSLPPRKWQSDSMQFTDGDYVLYNLQQKKLCHFQSQHITTASIVIGRLLVRFALVCTLKQDTEPQTAPDVLDGTLHGSHHHQCMNECINYYKLLWTQVSNKSPKM